MFCGEKKRKFKELISGTDGFRFRTLGDPEGECATLCTVIFDDPEKAARVRSSVEHDHRRQRAAGTSTPIWNTSIGT